MNNIEKAKYVAAQLAAKYCNGDFVRDTVENINQHLVLDPTDPEIDAFREFKKDYAEREKKWYLSHDLSIKGWMDDIKIWQFCASKDGKQEINSNYGYLVYDEKNGSQFDNAFLKLKENKESREAMVIFTRPQIHVDATADGKHDFICTNFYHFFIRKNKLEMILSQRSCDFVTGFPFDFNWACYVYNDMLTKLREVYPNLEAGTVQYNIDSLHTYMRSEKLLVNFIKNNKKLFEVGNGVVLTVDGLKKFKEITECE